MSRIISVILLIVSLNAYANSTSPEQIPEVLQGLDFSKKQLDEENGFVYVPFGKTPDFGRFWHFKGQIEVWSIRPDSFIDWYDKIDFKVQALGKVNGSYEKFLSKMGYSGTRDYYYIFGATPCEFTEDLNALIDSNQREKAYVNPRNTEADLCNGSITVDRSKTAQVKKLLKENKAIRPTISTIDCSEQSRNIDLNDALNSLAESKILDFDTQNGRYNGNYLKFIYESVNLVRTKPQLLGGSLGNYELWSEFMGKLKYKQANGKVEIEIPKEKIFRCDRSDRLIEIVPGVSGIEL